jgi:alkylation response protein AidB-like acyl-CoA dehydrogenase
MSEATLKGGVFLTSCTATEDVFTPEDLSSEQLQFAKTTRDFVENEVLPHSDRIEEKDLGLVVELMRKAGELGLFMADAPEEFGGMGLDKVSSALVTESIAGQSSFATMFGAHVGIGTLPIVYYGNEEQKARYLPALAEGSKLSCYCLTEPSAGSDAMSGRTKAVLDEDGKHYTLNGSKQFITGGGISDIFIVFAKVDGEHFTGFIVEKDFPGLIVGPEEHKMGIRGSSPTTVILDDCKVPVENLLGEIGKGHKIAFNILNVGRYKLGAAVTGSAKRVIGEALSYALERKQFGTRIADFGAIREKIAQMYVRASAAESAVYRTVGLIDSLKQLCGDNLQAIEEFSVECAMVKVIGSESIDYITDETVQIHGGYGYCSEYGAERHYRDSRINRIFEGTNEVNRLLIPTVLMRKAASGALSLDGVECSCAGDKGLVGRLKGAALIAFKCAATLDPKEFKGRQDILMRLSDLCMLAYTAESAMLRAKKAAAAGGVKAKLLDAVASVYAEEALEQALAHARRVLVAVLDGEELDSALAKLAELASSAPVDTLKLRGEIAARFIEDERVTF